MLRIKNMALNEEKMFGSINPAEGGELRARPVFKTIRHNSLMETGADTRVEPVRAPRKRRHGFEARKDNFSSYLSQYFITKGELEWMSKEFTAH